MDQNFTGQVLSDRLKKALDQLENATAEICVTSDEILNLLRVQAENSHEQSERREP